MTYAVKSNEQGKRYPITCSIQQLNIWRSTFSVDSLALSIVEDLRQFFDITKTEGGLVQNKP